MMVRDGVTSAFELEVGTGDVPAWYAAREGGQIVNYGVSIGHIPARMKVLGDPGTGLLPAGIGGSGTATEAQMAAMEAILREGLAQGAVAMGFGSAYTPGAPMSEIERMFRVAAEGGVSAHIHMRGGLAGLHETIAAAAAAHAPLHIVHVNSSADDELDAFLAAIKAARDAGQDVTTEAYPYGAGMTEIQSALFDDWKTWPDERFALHQLVSTGERLTRATFEQARQAGGTVIIHGRSEAADARGHRQPARDDRQRRLHRERPRTPAHVGHVREGARQIRARGEGGAADGRAAADDARAGAPPRAANAGDDEEGAHQGRRRRGPHDFRSRRRSSIARRMRTRRSRRREFPTWSSAARSWSTAATSRRPGRAARFARRVPGGRRTGDGHPWVMSRDVRQLDPFA